MDELPFQALSSKSVPYLLTEMELMWYVCALAYVRFCLQATHVRPHPACKPIAKHAPSLSLHVRRTMHLGYSQILPHRGTVCSQAVGERGGKLARS